MKKFAIIAAVAAAIVSVPAAAQETASVYYGDLDIASAAGTQALGERVQATANEVCARPDNRDLKVMLSWKECKDAAVTSGVEQLASKGIQITAAQ